MKRFWDKVDVRLEDECWNWTASKFQGKPYGQFQFNGTPIQAHRMAWLLTNGEIPHGMVVRHSCDNGTCVNPSHLLLGTPKDNVDDCINRKRRANNTGNHHNMKKTHCPRGHEYSKENTYIHGKIRKARRCKTCLLSKAKVK